VRFLIEGALVREIPQSCLGKRLAHSVNVQAQFTRGQFFAVDGFFLLSRRRGRRHAGGVRARNDHDAIGIADDDKDRLFRAFEQVGEAKSRKFEGTGLGLYISQKLAGILGGVIMMDSTPGAGSTFTLSLPAA